MTESSKMYLTDLEQNLAADDSGEYRDELCHELDRQAEEVQQQIDRGLAPADYEKAASLQAALRAARHVVEKTWHSEHSESPNSCSLRPAMP